MSITHVGWYKHPRTDLYQTWFSLDGKTITLASAHRRPQSARAAVKKIDKADEAGELTEPEKLQVFLTAIYKTGEPELAPFPEEIIKGFGLAG